MTHDPVDAVAELIRTRSMRIHVTPTVSYQVRQPCLLAQLEQALGVSEGRGGAATIPGSRPLIAADAWDLQTDILTGTYMWAQHLGVDRAPYRRPGIVIDPAARRRAAERAPSWMATLAPWLAPVAWDQPPESPVAASGVPRHAPTPVRPHTATLGRSLTPLRLNPEPAQPDIPPVGRLLRATLAEAIARGEQPIADRIGRSATSWAERITALLGQVQAAERTFSIRGEACDQCGATTAMEQRDDGLRYQVPTIQVRLLHPLELGDWDRGDDDQRAELWPYKVCLACGVNGWLSYTDNMRDLPQRVDPCACACHVGGAYRPACDVDGGCGSIGCDGNGWLTHDTSSEAA